MTSIFPLVFRYIRAALVRYTRVNKTKEEEEEAKEVLNSKNYGKKENRQKDNLVDPNPI